MLPLERRKWFQAAIGLASILLATACMLTVRAALPADADSARLALVLMFIGALSGFIKILQTFLPLLLLKMWPGLEINRSS